MDKAKNRAKNYLEKLPAIFSIEDARATFEGQKGNWVSVSLYRWKQYGLVLSAGTGDLSGWYYNIVKDPDWRTHRQELIERVWPIHSIQQESENLLVTVPHHRASCVPIGFELRVQPVNTILI